MAKVKKTEEIKPKEVKKQVVETSTHYDDWIGIDSGVFVIPFGKGLLVKVIGEPVIYVDDVSLAIKNSKPIVI